MYLTVNRRFDFCASRLLRLGSEKESLEWYGDDARGKYGQGRNYTAFCVFTGEIDQSTGMLVNLSDIKKTVRGLIEARYDHKNLNIDTPPFDKTPPTVELVARQLLSEVADTFREQPARPVACHLRETDRHAATVFSDGRTEVHYFIDFSAARQTCSPHLSPEQNRELFGSAASEAGHGHHYRARITLSDTVNEIAGTVGKPEEIRRRIGQLHELLDHKHLNKDVPELGGQPMTTEYLTRFLFNRLRNELPVVRVKLAENDWFFVEYGGDSQFKLGINSGFSAMHRLHTNALSDSQNSALYGKCNNPRGHGHYYAVETTLAGDLDERSGTLFPLEAIVKNLDGLISPFDNTFLDREVEAFRDIPSSGENIVLVLWKLMSAAYGAALSRVRLGETNNNRFAVRRAVS